MKATTMPTSNTRITHRIDSLDVCVVGGGLAGLCAALAAAREGAKTALIHDRPVLGGNASTEIRVPSSGAGHHNPCANETGIILELLTEERARNHDPSGYSMVNAHWDLILYDAVRREENLTALLNTHVNEVNMEGDRIRSVVGTQMGSERVWEIEAELFIDCTGDGVVGVAAGVPFRIGQEARSEYGESMAPDEPWDWTMGSSMFFRARDAGRPVEFVPPPWAERYPDETSLQHRGHGFIEGGYWWIEIGHPFDTIRDNEDIRDELLRHVLGVWDHIKNHCAQKQRAANYALDWVGMVPGKRESRRFIGAHVMTQSEIHSRTQYPDRVAYGGWIIDDHTKGGITQRAKKPSFDDVAEAVCLVAPYSVPLRSLYAREVRNLLFAGRLMSASRIVFNSLRVQRTLAVIGQAAGTAAARCTNVGREPGKLTDRDIHQIQQSLLRQDCYIPGVWNQDPDDVARRARVTASSSRPLLATPSDDGLLLERGLAQLVPLSAWPEKLRIYVSNAASEPRELRASLHRPRDIWDLKALEEDTCATLAFSVPGEFEGTTEACIQGGPCDPGIYWLRIEPAPGLTWLFEAAPTPGLTAARHDGESWTFTPGMFSDWTPFAADALPASRPFEPENVVNGAARPEAWPNVWVSEDGLPQWCRIELSEATELERVQIAWGLDFNRTYFPLPGLFRAPECARDYRIEVELADGASALWAEVRANYQRLRIHDRPQGFEGKARAILITVEATNGAPRVEICEVRAYRASRNDTG